MTLAFSSAVASGSYSSSAAKPSWMPGVFTTKAGLAESSHACSATGTMFLLLGRITTSAPGTESTTSRIWAVDGFIDCPPATMWWTPSE